ncbi:hypothetical protein S40293_05557 [Stachybotrys chartarum IBT 40293]|nr:hypothetical protein S40293_05557 [Stachybotrys chartarum IBT 40293]
MTVRSLPQRLQSCGFCHYKLIHGEEVVLVLVDYTVVTFTFGVDTLYSPPPLPRKNGPSQDSDSEALEPPEPEEWLACHVFCHGSCFCLSNMTATRLFRELNDRKYRFEPSLASRKTRARRHQRLIAPALNQHYPSLPMEICLEISSYLLDTYAALQDRKDCTYHLPIDEVISFEMPIWASYYVFDGVRYIRELQNETPGAPGWHLIHNTSRSLDCAYLVVNHVGVLDCILGSLALPQTYVAKEEVHWVSCPFRSAGGANLTYSWSTFVQFWFSPWREMWPSPLRIGQVMRYESLNPGRSSMNRRMLMLDLKPETNAISVLYDHNIINIHAHNSSKDVNGHTVLPLDYAPYHPRWLYMPLDESETIAEIWITDNHHGHTLIFKSSIGRVCVMGKQNDVEFGECRLVYSQAGSGGDVFFLHNRDGVEELFFEAPSPPVDEQLRVPEPENMPPEIDAREQLSFFTFANLSGVVQVRPCYLALKDHDVIKGLLLVDNYGHMASVGQVRPDKLGEPIDVTGGVFHLGFVKGKSGFQAVRIQTTTPDEDYGLFWLACPIYGRLEWWFSWRNSQVYHEGRTIEEDDANGEEDDPPGEPIDSDDVL